MKPAAAKDGVRARLDSQTDADGRSTVRRLKTPLLVVDQSAVSSYAYENVFIMLWRGATTDAALDSVHQALGILAMHHPEGIAIISIIERGATPPSAEHRAKVREFQEKLGPRLRCLALLVDGMGFWASAVLGAATAIISARRVRFAQRVCRTTDDAVAFVAHQMVGTASADALALRQAIDHARVDATTRASK
jgi:hypothetical protein